MLDVCDTIQACSAGLQPNVPVDQLLSYAREGLKAPSTPESRAYQTHNARAQGTEQQLQRAVGAKGLLRRGGHHCMPVTEKIADDDPASRGDLLLM